MNALSSFLFCIAAISLAGVGVVHLLHAPTGNPSCIQEVEQGLTVSRELGTLTRDPATGLYVCSRRTY